MAGEVPQLDGEVAALLAVVAGGGAEDADVGVDEPGWEVSGGAEVKEFEFLRGGVVEEVSPVGVCLHVFELGDFPETEAEDLRADPVPIGLSELWQLCHPSAFHALHGKHLRPGRLVEDLGDDEDVLFVCEEGSEALGRLCFPQIITFPCKLDPSVCNSFIKIEAFGEKA